jgi:hypothetical protein
MAAKTRHELGANRTEATKVNVNRLGPFVKITVGAESRFTQSAVVVNDVVALQLSFENVAMLLYPYVVSYPGIKDVTIASKIYPHA